MTRLLFLYLTFMYYHIRITFSFIFQDIDSTDYDRWCEYIFYRQLVRLGYARISKADLSDTEVQIAKFQIPDTLSSFQDNDEMTTSSVGVRKNLQFPDK